MSATSAGHRLRYPWQQAVFDALFEHNAGLIPGKITAAEASISRRLVEKPTDPGELLALQDALCALQLVFPESNLKLDPMEKIEVPGLD